MNAPSPVILALDTSELGEALAWSQAAGDAVGMVKIGLELFAAAGPEAVRALHADGRRVMLDLKLHDIPATVAAAVTALAGLGPGLLTVHASGGAAMVAAAVEAAQAAPGAAQAARTAAEAAPDGRPLRIVAVTVLTSLDAAELARLGLAAEAGTAAERLAWRAAGAGCSAFVCSPVDAPRLRGALGGDALLICPGVRPSGAGNDDQARIATPGAAIRAGADLLVVGRPITRAPDARAAAREIRDEALAAIAQRESSRPGVSEGAPDNPEALEHA